MNHTAAPMPQEIDGLPFRFRRQLLALLVSVFLLLFFVISISVSRLYSLHETEEMQDSLRHVESLLPTLLHERKDHLANLLATVCHINAFATPFLAGDREELQRRALPLFQQYREQEGITHFYFLKPDGEVLLRLHEPNRHGDKITRPSFLAAQGSGKTAAQLEVGVLGTLAIRVVVPWRVEERLIGYLELAVNWNEVQKRLSALTGYEFYSYLFKSMVKRPEWESGMRAMGMIPAWDEQSPVVFIGGTAAAPPGREVKELLHSQGGWVEPSSLEAWRNDSQRHLLKVPLKDDAGQAVGWLVIGRQMTTLSHASRHHLLVMLITALTMAVALTFIANRFMGVVEARLQEAGRALRRQIIRHQAILDTAIDGVITIDPLGRIREANPAAARLTGFPREELMGMDLAETLIPAELRERHRRGLARYLDEKEPRFLNRVLELPLLDAHGRRIPCEVATTAVHLEDEFLFTAFIRDVSERKQMFKSLEEALREAETANRQMMREITQRALTEEALKLERDKLTIILESMDAGVFIINQSRMVEFANQVVLNTYGDALGKHCQALFAQEERGDCPLCRLLERARYAPNRWEWRDEERDRGYDIFATRLPAGGEESSWLVVMHDITEHKRLEEQLTRATEAAEAANRAKSHFLAHVSHELRTPIATILGMGELLGDGDLSPTMRHYLALSNRAGELLLSLVNDLLDISKIEAGQMTLEFRPFDLPSMTQAVMELLSHRAREKGVEITLDVADDVPAWVTGDALRLRQIVLNLMGNGIKFTEQGEVKLILRREGEHHLLFQVKDTGIGILPAERDYLFQPFNQANPSIARKFGGTGLGLAICRRLVALMGGRIWLESEPGRGSLFSFTARLPAATGLGAALPQIVAAHAAHPLRWGRELAILLVEDTPENRFLVQAFLKGQPHRLEMVDNGAKGVAMFQAGRYDVVLMDMFMPVMDGYAATRAIRAWEREQGRAPTPIIAFTALAMKEDSLLCLEAGCNRHLDKPIKRDELLQAIWQSAEAAGLATASGSLTAG